MNDDLYQSPAVLAGEQFLRRSSCTAESDGVLAVGMYQVNSDLSRSRIPKDRPPQPSGTKSYLPVPDPVLGVHTVMRKWASLSSQQCVLSAYGNSANSERTISA